MRVVISRRVYHIPLPNSLFLSHPIIWYILYDYVITFLFFIMSILPEDDKTYCIFVINYFCFEKKWNWILITNYIISGLPFSRN